MEPSRRCAKPGCGEPGGATLSFDYAAGIVWVDDLQAVPEPAAYDLCTNHAERLTVPRGWERTDRRVTERSLYYRPIAS